MAHGIDRFNLASQSLVACVRSGVHSPAAMRLVDVRAKLAFAKVALTFALVWTTRAHAQSQPRTSSLSWVRMSGAESCVSTQTLARSVEARLRRVVFVSAAEADVSIEGVIAPEDAGFRATITLRDANGAPLGTRELRRESGECSALDESLALIIALMIDPDARTEPPEEPTPPPVEPPRTVIQKEIVVVQAPAKPAPKPKPTWRFDGGAAMTVLVGPLPGVGLGVQAHGLLEPPAPEPSRRMGFWPVFEGFGAIFPAASSDATSGNGSVTFSFGVLGGGICPLRYHGDRLHLYACVQGQLGVLTARGSGFVHERSIAPRVYLASGAAGRVSLRVVGPLAVRAGVGFAIPWLRHRYVYEETDGSVSELHRLAPVAAYADVGFGVVFP